MPTATLRQTRYASAAASVYTTAAFTPAADEELVVIVFTHATPVSGVVTDSQGLGMTTIEAESGHVVARSNSLTASVSTTITYTITGDTANDCVIYVWGVLGTSPSNIVQSAHQAGTSTSAVVTMDFAIDTNNTVVGGMEVTPSGISITQPTNWTEVSEGNVDAFRAEAAYRNSGETGSTITWTLASSQAYRGFVVELSGYTPPPPPSPC